LQELLSAGIEVAKATKLRRWLEGRMGIPLLSNDHLLRQYLGPLKVLEVNTLIAEFKDEFVGISELRVFWVCVGCDEIYI
jgi:hypothetical protein